MIPTTVNPFHLIVMDPPWPNKSVRRSAKYSEIDIYDLYRIPGKRLIAAGGYVAIWVTNNPKFCKFVYEKLFPTWGLVPVTEWFWLKVTTSGEWVLDLDSPHRKPYERLIIGKASTLATDSSSSLPSARKVICSVPSSHHSRKPFLEDLFVPFLPTNARKLELFARNVLPGWVAWGNEALKFNDTQFLTTMAES
ncbi:MT-A70-like protein [Gaertneriomyces semiglobifer]|nr:MT-A70-like protein [Gaertneriomyces semiglobifer]